MTAPEWRQTSWNSHMRHNSKALPTDSSEKQGSKHHFHRHAPNTGSCIHTPHFHRPSSSLQDSQAKHVPFQDLSIPQKGGTAISKGIMGVPGAALSLCPPTSPPATSQPQSGGRQGRNQPHWRKTAAAATVPLGQVLNGSQIPSNKSKCTDPIVCINLCTGACTPPHY